MFSSLSRQFYLHICSVVHMPLIITSDVYLLEHLVYTSINASSLNKLLRYTAPKPLPQFEKSNVLSTPTHENGRHWERPRMWNHQNWRDLRTWNLTALSTRFTWNRKLLKYTAPKFESGAVKDSKHIRSFVDSLRKQ